jgi:hypothetical protein
MDYKILRFYSQDADEQSFDFKSYTYYLKEPIRLDEEYTLTVKQILFDNHDAIYSYANQSQQYYIDQVQINDGININWGATTLGVYRYQDHGSGQTLIFEVYKESSTAESKARILGLNDYDHQGGGFSQFLIFQYVPNNPNPALLYTSGYLEIFNHTTKTWSQDFLWHKTTDFKIQPRVGEIPRVYYPPADTRKIKLFIRDIAYDSEQYISSSKDMSLGPMLCFLERAKTVQREMGKKYLLTLRPQTISKITLSFLDENNWGINNYKIYNQENNTFDNVSVVLILRKKNLDKKKSNLLLDKR